MLQTFAVVLMLFLIHSVRSCYTSSTSFRAWKSVVRPCRSATLPSLERKSLTRIEVLRQQVIVVLADDVEQPNTSTHISVSSRR